MLLTNTTPAICTLFSVNSNTFLLKSNKKRDCVDKPIFSLDLSYSWKIVLAIIQERMLLKEYQSKLKAEKSKQTHIS